MCLCVCVHFSRMSVQQKVKVFSEPVRARVVSNRAIGLVTPSATVCQTDSAAANQHTD